MKSKSLLNATINVGLCAISVLFSLAVGIGVLRCLDYDRKVKLEAFGWSYGISQFDPELGWTLVPNLKKTVKSRNAVISHNSHGFRGTEIDASKDLLVVSGDSVVYGYIVDDKETMPYFLNNLISGFNVEAVNLGVPGYALDQDWLRFNKYQNRLSKAKYLVLVVYTEDIVNGGDLYGVGNNFIHGKKKPLFTLRGGELSLVNKRIGRNALLNSATFHQAVGKIKNARLRLLLYRWVAGQRTLEQRQMERIASQILLTFKNHAQSHGMNLLVVLSPSTWKNMEYKSYSHRWFLKTAKKLGLNYLDFQDYILHGTNLKPNERKNIFLPGDVCHYNRVGNQLMAKAIYENLFLSNKNKPTKV